MKKKLRKYYDKMTPRELFRLFVGALSIGDTEEATKIRYIAYKISRGLRYDFQEGFILLQHIANDFYYNLSIMGFVLASQFYQGLSETLLKIGKFDFADGRREEINHLLNQHPKIEPVIILEFCEGFRQASAEIGIPVNTILFFSQHHKTLFSIDEIMKTIDKGAKPDEENIAAYKRCYWQGWKNSVAAEIL